MSLKGCLAGLITAVVLFSAFAVLGQTTTPSNTDEGKTTPTVSFRIGHGVIPPRVTYQTSPEYSEEARAAGLEGTCILSLVVGMDGKPRNIVVKHKLGSGLDEKAIEALQKFRFEPAMKDHKPVSMMVSAEVTFHLSGQKETNVSIVSEPSLPEDIASYCTKHPTGFYDLPGLSSGIRCSDWARQNPSKH